MSDGFARRVSAYNKRMTSQSERAAWSWAGKLAKRLSAKCGSCRRMIEPSRYCPHCGAVQSDE